MDQLLLGIDIGTTGTKTAIFNTGGELQSLGQAEYEVSIPNPGWAEQDPEIWWQALCRATREALKQLPGSPAQIAALAVSSQAPALLPINKQGIPVRPAMIWMDRRADEEAQILKNELGEGTIEQITGNHPDPFYVAPKLLWYRKHEPGNFKDTSVFLQVNGYINYKLTGRLTLDNVHASLLQLRNYSQDEWSDELCNAVGIDPGKFPAIFQGHEIIGEVTQAASAETGLRAGTPVMAGTVDGSAAALEAGAVQQGTVAEMTGTSTVLIMPNEKGIIEPAFIAMPHAIPGLHLLLGALVSTGACLKWFRDQLGQPEVELGRKLETSAYELLTRQGEEIKPGNKGVIFLPYMMGERSPIWHTHARGVFFGLSLATSKGDLIRAILEGTSFALYHNIEVAKSAGIHIHEIRSVGGGTKSTLWNQIKADVLGIPVLIPEASIGAPFGDAILAGMGIGYYRDTGSALKEMVEVKDRYEPDPASHKIYKDLFGIYKALYENLRNVFDRSASLRDGQ
jgi:xylulokinase